MKTIELKWIEDDGGAIVRQAHERLLDLIDTGVFSTLTCDCEDGVMNLTGDAEELDKAVMKLVHDFADYGQITIKESKGSGLRVESSEGDDLDKSLADLVDEYSNLDTGSTDYITRLGDLYLKFKKLKSSAATNQDRVSIQRYLRRVESALECAEVKKIKPIKNGVHRSPNES